MKRRMNQYDPISINLLLNYLSILVVPLIAIVISYHTALGVLVEKQTEIIEGNLLQTSYYISDTLRDATNIANYISNSKEIRDLSNSESSYLDFYKYVQNTTEYHLINNSIQSVYILFRDNKYIIKNKTIVPAKDFSYRSISKLDNRSYTDIMDMLSQPAKNSLSLSYDEGKIFIMQRFPYAQLDNFKGLVAVVLNDKAICNLLANSNFDEHGISLMLSQTDGKINIHNVSLGAKESLRPETLNLTALLQEKKRTVVLYNKEYVLNAHSDNYGFTYLSLVPLDIVLGQISNIKFIIISLSIASVLLALSICVILWRRRRNIILRIRTHKQDFEYHKSAEGPKNIWDSLSYMMDNIVDLQNNMKLQENFIRSSVVRKILLGLYDDEEALEKEVNTIRKQLDSKSYVVASIHIQYPDKSSKNKDLRLLIKNKFKDFAIHNQYCELASDKAAVLFFNKSEDSLAVLKEELNKLKNHLFEEWKIICYIGIGKEEQELLDISSSYESASKTSDYLHYNDMRTILLHNELEISKDVFIYPIETELHLVKAIKAANYKEVQDILRVLHYENYQHRKLSSSMNQNFLNMLKSSLLRELENHDSIHINIDLLRNLQHFDDISAFILSLVSAEQKKESQKHKELKEKIVAHIQVHYPDSNYTLFTLAESLDMSESKLYKIFKEIFNMSFSEYLENMRITQACELLKQKTQIKDVATLVGYSSDFSFRRAFKRSMGIPPSYYSEGLKKNS